MGIDVLSQFEAALTTEGLVFEKLSLKKYAPCCHWHIRKPGEKGTLEATYLLDTHRLWLECRSGRTAPWQEPVATRLEILFARDAQKPERDPL